MLQSRGTGGQSSSARGGVARRVEADLVRFSVTKLPSGLYRHRPVKFIFEIGQQQRRARRRAADD